MGATVCQPKKPLCWLCPLQAACRACAAGDPQRYPVRTRKLKRSSQSIWLLWAQTADGAVWLQARPTPGVWAGLQCFPLFGSESALLDAVPLPLRAALQTQTTFVHVLTHKDLHLHPWRLVLENETDLGALGGQWVGAAQWPAMGLPAPIRKLLASA